LRTHAAAAGAAAAVVAAAAVAADALSGAVVLDWHALISQERQEANAKLAELVAAHCGNDVDGEIRRLDFAVWQRSVLFPGCPLSRNSRDGSETAHPVTPTGFEPFVGVEWMCCSLLIGPN